MKFGPYGSYVPTYDSRLNNLHVKTADRNIKDQTKEEHRLEKNSLLKTYGGELELLYVQSIQVRFFQFCHPSRHQHPSPYVTNMQLFRDLLKGCLNLLLKQLKRF